MPDRSLELTDEHDAFVDRLIAEGRYRDASEVLREALRRLEAEEAEWESVKAGIMIGLAQAERGETVDGEEAFRLLREKYFAKA
ncbi:MAG: type II toxin-antitoxin system ParD family antitoxin [Gemmobacter sp.]